MIKGHLYRVGCADHFVTMLMAFLSRVFHPREFANLKFSGQDACIRIGECRFILFPLPQHLYEIVRDIKLKDLAERTRFNPVLSLMVVWRSEGLNEAGDGG